jgi:hypothetical protein
LKFYSFVKVLKSAGIDSKVLLFLLELASKNEIFPQPFYKSGFNEVANRSGSKLKDKVIRFQNVIFSLLSKNEKTPSSIFLMKGFKGILIK